MSILSSVTKSSRWLAVLIDPDNITEDRLLRLSEFSNKGFVQLFLIGGSLVLKNQIELVVDSLKSKCNTPIVIFPGSPSQIYDGADGLLLLSLISGRNADLLIGRHVESAFQLKNSGLEIIPTGYVLINGGKSTSVSYMSNTTPIPSDKPDIAAATALAGELLGLKAIYLEAGSGAIQPVPNAIIQRVAQTVEAPVFVGGGIKSKSDIEQAFLAGANVVVVGTAIENNPEWLQAHSAPVSAKIS